MSKLTGAVLIAVAVAVAAVSAAPARIIDDQPTREVPRYAVEFLPNPIPDDPLKPRGINENGDVTGFVDYPYRVFVNRPMTKTMLLPNLPGKAHGFGWEINDSGQVAGSSGFETIEPPERAVRWTAKGPQDLGTIGGDSRAYSVNNRGDVVGLVYVGGQSHGFFWSQPTGMIDLTPDLGFSVADDVNELGQVTGRLGNGRAFRWQNGVRQQLDPPAGYAYSAALAINERGQVAGQVKTASGNSEKFARWTDGIGWEVLGGVGQDNLFWGINDEGDAVGIGTSGGFRVGFVYLEGLGLYRLDTLLAQPNQWIILGAYDINNRGVIAAYATATDGSGRMGAVRLHPLAPPAA